MRGINKYYLWLLSALTCSHCLSAQIADSTNNLSGSLPVDSVVNSSPASYQKQTAFTIRTIFIEGNKKTKNKIILREVPFKTGESYLLQELVKKFEDARRQLMNTSLFENVVVALKSFEGYNIDILIQVKERWYLFPIPYIKPVDRNLNQWLVEQKGSLNRIDYGAKLLYNNVTGRNDKLRAFLINGYTKQISFSYDRLYIDNRMKWGLNTAFALGKNKEINYNTINDKQAFLKVDSYLRNFMAVSAELTYRRAIKTRHRFGISFTREEVSDTVLKLNPSYFSSSRKRMSYPGIYYKMTYYDLDYIPYPTKGYAVEIFAKKEGLNKIMNLWQFSASATGIWHTGKKTFFTLIAYGVVKLPFKQPYYTRRMLGYNDLSLQGYEYYVIDGVAAGYLKTSFTRKLFNFSVNTPRIKKWQAQHIPFAFYGKIYANAGYVHNPQPGENSLSNKMLYSAGFGIDIVTFYDFTLKLEWSFNQLGQNGLFLHRKSIF